MKSLWPKEFTLPIFGLPSQDLAYSKEIVTSKGTKDKMSFMKNKEEAEIYTSTP